MHLSQKSLPTVRLTVLAVFVAASATLFGYLWVNSGGRIPLITQAGYRVVVDLPSVSNLVYDSDVRMAGVVIGQVHDITVHDGGAQVGVELNEQAPLHDGVRIEVRNKTLIQETYLDITDGRGAGIPDGTELPPGTGQPAVELDDVFRTLDAPTRDALGSVVRSSGIATGDSAASLSDAVRGLGDVGRSGGTVTDALAAQSKDLETLTGRTATLLAALDTREGQIADLASDAHQVFAATARNKENVENTMRVLPGLLDSAHGASDDLTRLSTALGPVARDLRTASPDLSAALQQLPGTSADLRGLLPSLQGVLDKAPATLDRTPTVADDLGSLVRTTDVALSDVNPMLGYLQPYGRDVAAMFTNFSRSAGRGDVNGNTLRLFMVFNEQTVKGNPVDLNKVPLLDKSNAYPKPGQSADPGPFTGQYPRVQPEPPR